MIAVDRPFYGKRILLVEDEYLLADEMTREFEDGGAEVAGPVPTVEKAMMVLTQGKPIDAAVLDINLRGAMVFQVAECLMTRGVPFVFATGYDDAMIPPKFDHIPRCEKPVAPGVLAKALLEVRGSKADAAR